MRSVLFIACGLLVRVSSGNVASDGQVTQFHDHYGVSDCAFGLNRLKSEG
ncbi:hypothetical protein GALL_421050 [mine drainage metagenome]|uniref:Uncharacterized protein n=1 Tax=mine drainage metagenome TaxID=410659 RepID=A0A1J5PXK7_9ZZZZ